MNELSLSNAINCNDIDKVKQIIANKNQKYLEGTGYTYLLGNAAERNFLDIVKILLNAGVKPNDANEILIPSETPLSRAAAKGYTKIVQILIAANAVIDTEWNDLEYLTPLKYAIRSENIETVKILVESGANVNETRYGFTFPLMIAAEGIVRSSNNYRQKSYQNIYDYLEPLTTLELCLKAKNYLENK